MSCPKSYALGRWRGAQGKPLFATFADTVDHPSYVDGHIHGRSERAERAAKAETTIKAKR